MNARHRSAGRVIVVAIRSMIALTVILGLGYTAAITLVGAAVPGRADGSLVRDADGQVVGSALIGQSFTDADGNPLPQYFQGRPSAAGDGYDAGASSGSNLGPNNADLIALIAERQQAIADLNGVPVADIPADAVTASASGLDPHISPAYARLQVARIAEVRSLPEDDVRALVEAHVNQATLGFLGQDTVNVLELNLALDRMGR